MNFKSIIFSVLFLSLCLFTLPTIADSNKNDVCERNDKPKKCSEQLEPIPESEPELIPESEPKPIPESEPKSSTDSEPEITANGTLEVYIDSKLIEQFNIYFDNFESSDNEELENVKLLIQDNVVEIYTFDEEIIGIIAILDDRSSNILEDFVPRS